MHDREEIMALAGLWISKQVTLYFGVVLMIVSASRCRVNLQAHNSTKKGPSFHQNLGSIMKASCGQHFNCGRESKLQAIFICHCYAKMDCLVIIRIIFIALESWLWVINVKSFQPYFSEIKSFSYYLDKFSDSTF